jgi:hypothetical protein
MRSWMAQLLAVLVLFSSVRAQDHAELQFQSAHRLRLLSMAMARYAQTNNGQLPPDLASLVPYTAEDPANPGPAPALIRALFVDPAYPTEVPDDAAAEWVNEHSPYKYLGRSDVSVADLPSWNKIVVAHLRLDSPIMGPPTEWAPDGAMYTAAFIDGHASIVPREQLEAMIIHTNQVFDALATGASFPDATQIEWSLSNLCGAMIAYAKAHDGRLPPDQGSLLEFVPSRQKRLGSPKARASVFLSPAALRNTFIPDDPTPEWVNQHASYLYLGDDSLLLPRIDDTRLIFFRAPADQPLSVPGPDGRPRSRIPIHNQSFVLARAEDAEALTLETRQVFTAMRERRQLPDYQHALRDLRLLNAASEAYARSHGGELPPDLAATLDFLSSDELPTPAHKALVYLSPRAERGYGEAPQSVDADWVRGHANYRYLGAGKTLKWLRESSEHLLLHAPLDEVHQVRHPGFTRSMIPCADGFSGATADQPEELERKLTPLQQTPP